MTFYEALKLWGRMCAHVKKRNNRLGSTRCAHCDMFPICDSSPIERAKIIEKCDIEMILKKWGERHPEKQYPTWGEWLLSIGAMDGDDESGYTLHYTKKIPAEIAEQHHIPAIGEATNDED